MVELERAIPILIGIPLVAMGFGLTASFGILAFLSFLGSAFLIGWLMFPFPS